VGFNMQQRLLGLFSLLALLTFANAECEVQVAPAAVAVAPSGQLSLSISAGTAAVSTFCSRFATSFSPSSLTGSGTVTVTMGSAVGLGYLNVTIQDNNHAGGPCVAYAAIRVLVQPASPVTGSLESSCSPQTHSWAMGPQSVPTVTSVTVLQTATACVSGYTTVDGPGCQAALGYCPAKPAPTNGVSSCEVRHTRKLTDTCTFQCNAGYFVTGQYYGQCTLSTPSVGIWSYGFGSATCNTCPVGRFTATTSTSCSYCPPGKTNSGSDQTACELTCGPGQYSYGGPCHNCHANTWSAVASSSCSSCAQGKYSLTTGRSTDCDSCPSPATLTVGALPTTRVPVGELVTINATLSAALPTSLHFYVGYGGSSSVTFSPSSTNFNSAGVQTIALTGLSGGYITIYYYMSGTTTTCVSLSSTSGQITFEGTIAPYTWTANIVAGATIGPPYPYTAYSDNTVDNGFIATDGQHITADFSGTRVVTKVGIYAVLNNAARGCHFALQRSTNNVNWGDEALFEYTTSSGGASVGASGYAGRYDYSANGTVAYRFWRLEFRNTTILHCPRSSTVKWFGY